MEVSIQNDERIANESDHVDTFETVIWIASEPAISKLGKYALELLRFS